jgi:intein/homing endonuclease
MKKVKLLNNKIGIKLEKIDSKELAYIIGFICADGAIANNNSVEFGVKLEDKEILDFISNVLECTLNIDLTYDKKSRRFPRVRFTKNIPDILNFIKSKLKEDRILPIINPKLNRYLILGFFDGDGCITWGRRKDRNRIWQKFSFTSSYKMLTHIQQTLLKIGISSIIKPKKEEKTFVLESSNKKDVLTFMEWLYKDKDFIILKRKFNKFNALRLELDKFGETTYKSTIPSQAESTLSEGVETSGEVKSS